MSFFTALLRRPVRRHYALLDDACLCRMLLTAAERPRGERWIEVPEVCLGWIGKPLPADALATPGLQGLTP